MSLTDEASAIVKILSESANGLARAGQFQASGLCATGALTVSRLAERVRELEGHVRELERALIGTGAPAEAAGDG